MGLKQVVDFVDIVNMESWNFMLPDATTIISIEPKNPKSEKLEPHASNTCELCAAPGVNVQVLMVWDV